jgi:short-subunit dehydrogenase
MIAHGQGAHVVNTASMAGLLPGGDGGLYSATKFAVVSLSETLYLQLRSAGAHVSVSVLCPGWVNTNITQSQRNRPGGPVAEGEAELDPRRAAMRGWVERQIKEGLDPRDVGQQVLDAVLADKFYILTHPTWAPLVAARMQRILAGESPRPAAVPGVESLMEKLGPPLG